MTAVAKPVPIIHAQGDVSWPDQTLIVGGDRHGTLRRHGLPGPGIWSPGPKAGDAIPATSFRSG